MFADGRDDASLVTFSQVDSGEHADLMWYDHYCARIYDDTRMSATVRELALAMLWVLLRDPQVATLRRACGHAAPRPAVPDRTLAIARFGDVPRSCGDDRAIAGAFWPRLCDLVGSVRRGTRRADLEHRAPQPGALIALGADSPAPGLCTRLMAMLGEDVPRYEPPAHVHRRCAAPLIRRTGVCNQHGVAEAVEYDPVTGWVVRSYWYCRRHQDLCAQLQSHLRRTPRPEPIPNRGGVLPCYFDTDWQTIYAMAWPRWRTPYHGLRADDWPDPDHDAVPRPPQLMLIRGRRHR